VLRAVWGAADPVTPGEVRDAVDAGVAYTTVLTVLSRLHDKGLVRRDRDGRAFRYRPSVSEAELTAERMGSNLAAATHREAALAQFVARLEPGDAQLLRRLLGHPQEGS